MDTFNTKNRDAHISVTIKNVFEFKNYSCATEKNLIVHSMFYKSVIIILYQVWILMNFDNSYNILSLLPQRATFGDVKRELLLAIKADVVLITQFSALGVCASVNLRCVGCVSALAELEVLLLVQADHAYVSLDAPVCFPLLQP